MGELGVLIPIIALMIPVLGLVVHISGQWLKSPVANALADRVRGVNSLEQADLHQEVQALAGEIDGLRRELAEVQERIDFAERLIAARPESSRLSAPRENH